jgi:hypothetical protein
VKKIALSVCLALFALGAMPLRADVVLVLPHPPHHYHHHHHHHHRRPMIVVRHDDDHGHR